jgi:hypothetical protein
MQEFNECKNDEVNNSSNNIAEINYIYLKHIDDDVIWKITETSAIHSKLIKESIIEIDNEENYGKSPQYPMILKTINITTIPLIISYFKFYDNIAESCSPELPLKNIHISYILGDEYNLFKSLYKINDLNKDKIIILNNHITTALYFGFKYLHEKLCAIVANILKDLEIHELQALML